MLFSVYLWFLVDKEQGAFVGIWVPSILLLGAFFKKWIRCPERASKAGLVIIFCATMSFLLSIYLWFFLDKQQGLFVGLWVPSILGFGNLFLIEKGND